MQNQNQIINDPINSSSLNMLKVLLTKQKDLLRGREVGELKAVNQKEKSEFQSGKKESSKEATESWREVAKEDREF